MGYVNFLEGTPLVLGFSSDFSPVLGLPKADGSDKRTVKVPANWLGKLSKQNAVEIDHGISLRWVYYQPLLLLGCGLMTIPPTVDG